MPKTQFESIGGYIKSLPKDIQPILEKLRETIKKSAPEAEEAIRYQIPTFRLNDKNLVHFAGFTHHIGFYPTPSAIEEFKKDVSKYKWEKGSVQFPLNQKIPYDLVKKMVEFRVKEVSK